MLLSTTTLFVTHPAYAAKTMIGDRSVNFVNKGTTFSQSSGVGATIPSGSKDYSFRVYGSFPSSAGSVKITFNLYTDQVINNSYVGQIIYENTVPAGWSGWIDIPNIPESSNGQSFTTYSLGGKASRETSETRTLRLQTFYEDVTPPTAPTITLNQPEITWTSTPIQVSIGGSTDDSGIAKYAYNIDGGNWIDYTGPFNAPGGQHTIRSVAYDNNGLSGSWSQPVTTYYDPVAPTAPTLLNFDSSKWYKSFPLEFSAGSGGLSGVRGVLYTLSGAMNNPERAYDSNHAQVLSANGTTTVSAVTWSLAGARSEPLTQTIQIDAQGPISSLSIPTGYAQSMMIHVTAKDDQSGMKSITLPNGQTVNVSQYDYPIQENGQYVFQFEDMLGNISTNHIDVSTIDTTPPTVPTVTSSSTKWSAQPVSITIGNSTDDISGVDHYGYRIDGGAEQVYSTTIMAPEGQHTIEARAYDKIGLRSEWSAPVTTYYAPNAPGAPVLNGLPSNWTNQDVEFTITPGSDAVAGIDSTEYRLSTGRNWFKSLEGTISREGVTTITARSTNKAGGVSASTEGKVYLDKTAPDGLLALSSAGWTKSLSIRATGTDTVSGIDHIVLPDGKVTKENPLSYPVSQNGDYTFTFVDIAGNSTSKTITVSDIDNTPPMIETGVVDSAWTDQPQVISYSIQDKESGLDTNNMYYAWSTSDQAPTTWSQKLDSSGTFAPNQTGIWYLHLQAQDYLGNMSQQTLGPWRIQHVPEIPTVSVIGTATDKMLLNWSLPVGGVNTDGLQYDVRNENTGKSWTLDYPTNELQDSSLTGGTEYRYTVVAKNHVGSSLSSSITGVTLPPATVISSVYTSGEDYSKALIDIMPVPSATRYHVTATNWTTQEIDAEVMFTDTASQELPGLKPYTMYDFAVQAINASGAGATTHTSFLTLPDMPNGFKSAQISDDSILLGWNSVTRAVYDWSSVSDDTYYQLRRDNQIIYKGPFPMYQDTGLQSGTAYDYDAAAGNSTGWGSKAVLSQIWTLPLKPRQVIQSEATSTSFTIDMDVPRGTKGFRAVIDGSKVMNLGSALNRYTFHDFEPGSTHQVEIAAYNQSGIGKSISLIATTLPESPKADTIQIVSIQNDSVTFKVVDIPGATKYKLSINGKEYEVASGETTIHGLQPGTLYDFKLHAGNSAGYSDGYTNQVLTLPSVPTQYKVIESTPTSLTLSWDKVEGADYYEVLDASGTSLQKVADPQYKASGLHPGESVSFQIRAINASGAGECSSYHFRMLPGFEKETDYSKLVKIDKVNLHEVQISWVAVPGAEEYRLYNDLHKLITQTTERHVVIDQLTSATSYNGYTVVPVNDSGEGKAMSIPSWATLPDDMINLSYESTKDSITIHLEQKLGNEILVIQSQGKELYRGPAKDYNEFKQDRLSADTTYSYVIWTENEQGRAANKHTIEISTKKERATVPAVQKSVSPQVSETEATEDTTEQSEVPEAVVNTADHNKNKKGFIDIDGNYANESITRLADLGIVKGISDDLYAPRAGTTRAEFMSMLTRLSLSPEQIKQAAGQELQFNDIDANDWYIPELQAAVANGIVAGFSKEEFRPDQQIDREQAAKMLGAVIHTIIPTSDSELYADSSTVSDWAKQDVNGLTLTSVLQGYPDQTFRPHSHLTRAESAVMIDRALQKGMLGRTKS